jgi:hypothetical protein
MIRSKEDSGINNVSFLREWADGTNFNKEGFTE